MALKTNWELAPQPRVRTWSPVEPTPFPTRLRRVGPPADGGARDVEQAVRRARDAILEAGPSLTDADASKSRALRVARACSQPRLVAPLLAAWRSRTSAGPDHARRAPWSLGVDALPPTGLNSGDEGANWRPRERDWLEREPTAFGQRLLGPIAMSDGLDFLAEAAEDANPEIARTAAEILRETQPIVEGEAADWIKGDDPWRDTFGLWLLSRRPRALELLRPLVIALATRIGTRASRLAGLPCGTRYPFEAVPLVSASAHLGLGLWVLAYRPSLLPGLLAFVADRQDRDGGFGDEGQPADILTTLACTEFLGTLDPAFDPRSVHEFFLSHQEAGGWWRALDPEIVWLTAEIADWLELTERPFHERFRWPALTRTDLDRKTGIPGYATFDTLERTLATVPGLASAPIGLAFTDLAGFREFNNQCGQDLGDEVLRFFAQHLKTVEGALPIRDGGDEFLILGAPTQPFLADDVELLRATWPDRFRARFGPDVPVVAPRFLVGATVGRDIGRLRERMGREIGRLKFEPLDPGGRGILRVIDG